MFDEDENEPLHSSKANIISASVRVAKVKGEFIPPNDLVRFQLLEYLLRCAIKKYYESEVVENEVEAVKMFIENHINKYVTDSFD